MQTSTHFAFLGSSVHILTIIKYVLFYSYLFFLTLLFIGSDTILSLLWWNYVGESYVTSELYSRMRTWLYQRIYGKEKVLIPSELKTAFPVILNEGPPHH